MRVAAGVALMLTFVAGGARAEQPQNSASCAGPSLVLEPPLSYRRSWQEAAGDTRKRVAELADVDACTRLEVAQTENHVHVRAQAGDGRSVVRDLASPSELEPTVVALLVLPPAERGEALTEPTQEPAKTAPPAPKPVPPASPRQPLTARALSDAPGAGELGADGAAGTRTELSLAAAGRASGYLVGPGAVAMLDWSLGGWLIGATARAEQVTGATSASRFSLERSAALGAVFGRRLVRRPFYLDVGLAAPLFAVSSARWQSQTLVTPPATGGTGEPGEVEPGDTDDVPPPAPAPYQTTSTRFTPATFDLRAGAFVRGVVPFRGGLSATLASDVEHSLGVLPVPERSGQPSALGLNFGVALGLFWGAR